MIQSPSIVQPVPSIQADAVPPTSTATAMTVSPDSRCSGCSLRLFSTVKQGGKVITLSNGAEAYHARCFVCASCKKAFEDGVFVVLDDGRRVHEKVGIPLQLSKLS